jgi:hypothetical protein
MRYLQIILLQLTIVSSSYCQSFKWLTEIKGDSYEEIQGTCVSKGGNIYVTGYLDASNIHSFGNLTVPDMSSLTYFYGYFTAKCNASGNFEWVRAGGGGTYNEGKSITCDSNDNIYTTGYCTGNPIFSDTSLGFPSNGERTLLIKYDTNGKLKWIRRFGSENSNIGYGKILRYSDGYLYDLVYVRDIGQTNIFSQTIQLRYVNNNYLAKFDTAGNFIHAKLLLENTGDQVVSDVLVKDGNIYTAGYFNRDIIIDSATYQLPFNGYQSFITKQDTSGNLIWSKKFSSSNSVNYIYSLATDDQHNILVTGVYYDTLNVDGTVLINPISSFCNSFLCKLNSDGHLLWIKDIRGPGNVYSVSVVNNINNIYLGGYFIGYLNTGSLNLSNLVGYSLFLIGYDKSGNLIDGKSYGSINYVQLNNMGIDAEGYLYGSCQYLNSTLIGPYHLYADSLIDPLWNATDAFLFKYDSKGISESINKNTIDNLEIVYPNPNDGLFKVSFNSDPHEIVNARIYNTSGVLVKELVLSNESKIINCHELPNGLYLIKLYSPNKEFTCKFIKE